MPTRDPTGKVEPFDPGFRHYLREWRQRRGISQGDVATLIGTHKGMISRYETSRRSLTLEMLFKLCHALEITRAQLFCDPEEESVDAMLDGVPFAERLRVRDVVRVMIGKRAKNYSE